MTTTMNSLIRLIGDVQGLINPIISITNSLVGQNSFFSLINCKFIGADIENVIQSFSGGFSYAAKNLGIMIVIIAFINALMIIATIFMINFTIELPSVLGETVQQGVPVDHMEMQHLGTPKI